MTIKRNLVLMNICFTAPFLVLFRSLERIGPTTGSHIEVIPNSCGTQQTERCGESKQMIISKVKSKEERYLHDGRLKITSTKFRMDDIFKMPILKSQAYNVHF